MKFKFSFFIIFIVFICSCASTHKEIKQEPDNNILYTVKVVNTSSDKVSLRYEASDLSYTFRFVDLNNEVKFLMNGNLTVQYSLKDYDDAKIIKIKQDTFIQVKQNDIIIDDLPPAEKIIPGKKAVTSPGTDKAPKGK